MLQNFYEIRYTKSGRPQTQLVYAENADRALEKMREMEPEADQLRVTKDLLADAVPKELKTRSVWSVLSEADKRELRRDLQDDHSALANAILGRGDTGGRPTRERAGHRIGPLVVNDG